LDESWTDARTRAGFDDGAADMGTPGAAEGWFTTTKPADDMTAEDATAQETEAVVDPEPIVEPTEPEPAPASSPELESEPESESLPEPEPEPIREPTAEPAPEPDTVPASIIDPVPEPETELQTGTAPEIEPVVQESSAEPMPVPETPPPSEPEPAQEQEPPSTAEPTSEPDPMPETPREVPDAPPASIVSYPEGTLVLNEIVSDGDEEWIEIYNPYNNVIPLGGWAVRDESGRPTALPDQLLGWDQYVLVRNPLGKLNNDADSVELRGPNGAVVDTVSYGQNGMPAARRPNALALGEDGSWHVTTTPTPGAANQTGAAATTTTTVRTDTAAAKPAEAEPRGSGGTSRRANKASEKQGEVVVNEPKENMANAEAPIWSGPTTLRISEIYPNTTENDLTEEFIELENVGDVPVDLVGWTLADQSGRTYVQKSRLIVGPRAFLTLTRPETRLALNNTGDSVTLIAPDETAVDFQAYATTTKGSALVRSDADWVWTRTPTPDEPNVVSQDENPRPEAARPAAAKAASSAMASASGGSRSMTTSLEGTVLVAPGVLGSQIFYVETEAGGIQVYKHDGDFPALSPGDRVAVVGTPTENRGEPRVKISSARGISLIGREEPPAAQTMTIGSLTGADHGRLIRVAGTVLSKSGTKAVLEEDGAKLSVRAADGADIDMSAFAKGAHLDVTGVLVATDSGLTLLPRSAEDVTRADRQTVEAEQTAPPAEASGKAARGDADRAVSLAITAAVVAGLGLYSSRRAVRSIRHWYAKTRTLRAASETAR
jgi:hypothetical protein